MAFAPQPPIICNNFSGGENNIIFVSQPNNREPIHNNMPTLLNQKQSIFAFAVSALLATLQLKHGDDSPFVTHPKMMGVAVTSILFYWLGCDVELVISSNNAIATIIRQVVRFLGYCSIASLAWVLASPFSVAPLPYLVLALFSVLLLLFNIYTRFFMQTQNDMMHALVRLPV